MSFLRLSNIFKYAHCTPDIRNFVKGEQVLLAKHVILCRKIKYSKINNIVKYIQQKVKMICNFKVPKFSRSVKK